MDNKPDPYEKLALLRMLTHAHAQADAYFEMIGDAAVLAANQVQDIRLDYLEKGPTVTAADVLLELFLSVGLQYAGGKAIELITRKIMTRVLSTRSALLLISGRTEYGDRVANIYRMYKLLSFTELGVGMAKKGYEAGAKAADIALRRQVFEGVDKLYNETPFIIADLATKVVFNVGRKLPEKTVRYTRLSPQDSPGVALLDNVSLFVTRQQIFNKILFDDTVHIVLLDILSREDLLNLIKDLEAYTTGLYGSQSLPEIKQHYKLFFEACLWARILYPPPRFKGVPPILDLGDKSKDFTEYLLTRIINPETEVPFAELIREIPPSVRRRSDEPTNEYYVLNSLLHYFRLLREMMEEMEARLPTEGRSQWNYK